MSKRSNIRIIAMACIMISVLTASVYAEDAAPQAPPQGAGPGDMSGLLKNLTERGFDVTDIQAAEEKGDKDSAKALLNKFIETHPEAKPQMPPMDADRLKKIVANLASKGNDVAAIQAALDSGDSTTAQKLLDNFFNEHPDSRPTPPADGQKPPAQ